MKANPWEILGIPRGSDQATIKRRFRELALRHHPDKLGHLSPEERQTSEESFKEIVAAYQFLTRDVGSDSDCSGDGWAGFWERVRTTPVHPGIWDILKGLAAQYQNLKRSSGAVGPRVFELPVSLEDIHLNRMKKLRLFLKGATDPVYVRVFCGAYPEYRTTVERLDTEDELGIIVRMILKPHPIWTLDELFGTKDLFAEIDISWLEYLKGTRRSVPYLDGSPIVLEIPAFFGGSGGSAGSGSTGSVIPGKGLTGKPEEKMYIHYRVRPPTFAEWRRASEENRRQLCDALEALGSAGAGGRT